MTFDLENFIPYRLNQAAESASQGFREIYRRKYGLTRAEWRVLFHVGQYGPISAVDISKRAYLHKTKISRAVQKLEDKRWLKRLYASDDRRIHTLQLTASGRKILSDLTMAAEKFNRTLIEKLGAGEADILLRRLMILEQAEAVPKRSGKSP